MRIIYFDIDCLRPDHLGCYGYQRPTSPNIDWVAGEGRRFDSYYCASSPCLPSRTALFSGRFGMRNGVVSNHGAGARFHLRTRRYGGPQPDNEMLMRHLRAAGYDTISFSNFADRHSALWFMIGWSEFHTPNLKGGRRRRGGARRPHALAQDTTRGATTTSSTSTTGTPTAATRWTPPGRIASPDYPVTQAWPDEEAIRAHQAITGPFTAQGQFKDGASPCPLMPGSVASRRDFEHMVTGYDASIAYVDHHVGSCWTSSTARGCWMTP